MFGNLKNPVNMLQRKTSYINQYKNKLIFLLNIVWFDNLKIKFKIRFLLLLLFLLLIIIIIIIIIILYLFPLDYVIKKINIADCSGRQWWTVAAGGNGRWKTMVASDGKRW